MAEPLGQILLRRASLTQEQLSAALADQRDWAESERLGQVLLAHGAVSPGELAKALADQWQLECAVSIPPAWLNRELVTGFPLQFLKKHRVIPLCPQAGAMAVGMADPLDVPAFDALAGRLGGHLPAAAAVARIVCPPAAIDEAISRCYYQEGDTAATILDGLTADDDAAATATISQPEDLLDVANRAPIVKLVNAIFFQAVGCRASDIHIEPYDSSVRVRFRVDGVLHTKFAPPRQYAAALISRLKVMANLNIAERRLPQDGRSRIRIGEKEIDVRVSTIPTHGGERVVLRLLDKTSARLGLGDLGFSPDIDAAFRRLVRLPHGIVLLTGPTGSGKTTTLYGALSEINKDDKNILTVEDPIEYQLHGIGQMQIKSKIGLTFANCLRHVLRQDPNVIMVGEIRDHETAEIAIQAALTGHLVFSTLHTNDAATAVTRLVDMGIEPYLISSSVAAIMAQRLVRSICPACSESYRPEADVAALFDGIGSMPEQLFRGRGCTHCIGTGYHGRSGICELLVVDDRIRELIMNRAPANVIRNLAIQNGMATLRDDGLRKALEGLTTVEEVLRVTQDDTVM